MTAPLPTPVPGILDVRNGQLLDPTVENATLAISVARDAKAMIDRAIVGATAWLAEESRRQGTKTLRQGDAEVVLRGGPSIEYDPERLAELLRAAGCPEERIAEAIVPTVTYTVNRSVLRQLTGANPAYKAAAEAASFTVEKSVSASVKSRPEG